ncbi:PAS domain S-box protein [Rhodohalobacter halophilus]|uniref:PAS domain S-box protein n=1 Tax=Rhodohalobacter halophilus TaxID=1812810 RepID=UPI00083F96DF|nr:PAS domain S-box protein [Rhodohalobacter halophilus]
MNISDDIFKSSPFGFAYHKLVMENGKPADYIFEEVNQTFEELTGLSGSQIIGKHATDVLPGIRNGDTDWVELYADVALKGEEIVVEQYSSPLDRWYQVQAWSDKKGYFATLFTDITEKKCAELRQKAVDAEYKEIFSKVSRSIFVIDVTADGRYVVKDFNERQLTYLNMSREEVQGKYIEEAFPQDVAKSIISHYNECIEKGEEISYEEDVTMAGRGRRYYFTTITPLRENSGGRIHRLVGSSVEITKRKEAEIALMREQEFNKALLESAADGVVACDENGNLVLFNKRARDWHGVDLMKIPVAEASHYYDLFHLDGKTPLKPDEIPLARAFNGEILVNAGMSIVPKGENPRFISASGSPIYDKEGNKLGAVILMRDVTARLKAEEQLRENEERLAATLRSIGDGVISCDRNGKVLSINNVAESLTGWSSEEAEGKPIDEVFQIFNAQTREVADNPVMRSLEEGVIVGLENHTILKSRSGEEFQIADRCAPIKSAEGEIIGCVLVFRDVTREYYQKRALEESEERFRNLAFNVPGVIYLCKNDENYSMIFVNHQIKELTGYTREEFEDGKIHLIDIFHPDDREMIKETVDRALQNRESYQIEYRMRHRDGESRWVMENGVGIFDEKGDLQHLEGYISDITDKKLAEELTHKASQQLEFHVENSPLAVVVSDKNFNVLQWSKSAEQLFGWSEEEVLSMSRSEWNFTFEEDIPNVKAKMNELIHGDKPRNLSVNRNYTKEGDLLHCEWYNSAMLDKDGNLVSVFSLVHNVTDQVQKEQKIKESLLEKETLLAEIHHRVKNNLAVVSGLMQLQALEAESESLQAKLFDSVNRIKTMASVHELLYQSDSYSRLNFSDTIRKLVENISATFQASKEIDVEVETDNIELNINMAIPASLIVNEVVTNVFKHAFPDQTDGRFSVILQDLGQKISIIINDDGVGIAEDDNNPGSSLGMHLIRELASQIKGEYTFRNTDPGTEFRITFARSKE